MTAESQEYGYLDTKIHWKNSLGLKIVIPIFILSVICVGVLGYFVPTMQEKNVVQEATITAQNTVKQFKILRKYYTQHVIKKVIGVSDIKASFNHADVDKTIPLPATLIHDMSTLLEGSETSLKLYSAYPFPNRQTRKQDQFAKNAWEYLRKNPDGTYVQKTKNNGANTVRVAVADKMVDTACVNCHNSHPDTPFANWKLGDVRGVLEVNTNIDTQINNGYGVSRTIILSILFTLLTILGFTWFMIKQKIIKPFEQAVQVANRISNNDLHVDIGEGSADETGALLNALQKMRDNLQLRGNADQQAMVEVSRIKQALDKVDANIMIADNACNIVYINDSLKAFFNTVENDFREELHDFRVDVLVGTNLDVFQQSQALQHRAIDKPSGTDIVTIKIGDIDLGIITKPVIDGNGERVGLVIEWQNRYQEIVIQREVRDILQSALMGDLTRRISLQDKNDFFEELSRGINQLLEVFDNIVSDTATVLSTLATGNLTRKMESEYQGTFALLKNDVNMTIEKLTQVVVQISEGASQVMSGSQEITQANKDLSGRTEQQAANLQDTASSMEQMTSTVKQNADNAILADQLATGARTQAEDGSKVVEQAVSAMSAITESSNQIAAIIGVIDDIAFQTNLLALNASVEAARAGEQGRGFAVVATEVRNLAGRSATAAKEIKDLIEDSVAKVEEGSNLVDDSGETLGKIMDSIKKVSEIVTEISTASQEQSDAIEQVNHAITQMDDMTQKNTTLVEQAAVASELMGKQALGLIDKVSFFKTGESFESEQRQTDHLWDAEPSAKLTVVQSTTAVDNSDDKNTLKAAKSAYAIGANVSDAQWEAF